MLSQTLNYQNTSLIKIYRALLSSNPNLVISVRCVDSFEFAKKNFPSSKIFFVPDTAFMIGPVKPTASPIFDLLILRRTHKESKFDDMAWETAIKLINSKYTYKDVDRYFFKDENNSFYKFDYHKYGYKTLSANSFQHIKKIGLFDPLIKAFEFSNTDIKLSLKA
jgi:exopolysaccharide biosynthesis predicted pyruvyltransferase EpsI